MPPVHPPLKNDGPACRVCGCTKNNACVDDDIFGEACSWVKTRGVDVGPLCSACAGTADDLAEAIGRATERPAPIGTALKVLTAALARYEKRKKEVDAAR